MNALKLLAQDHAKLKQLFGTFQALHGSASARRQEIADEIFREIQLHSRVEEEIFYPALNARASSQGRELVEDGLDAHAEADEQIRELRRLDPAGRDYARRFQALVDGMTEHMEEEESLLFPEAERRLGSELVALGRELEEEKASAAAESL